MNNICLHCQKSNLEEYTEEMYDDGTDEPNTSNQLVAVKLYRCLECGEVLNEEDMQMGKLRKTINKFIHYIPHSQPMSDIRADEILLALKKNFKVNIQLWNSELYVEITFYPISFTWELGKELSEQSNQTIDSLLELFNIN